MNKRDVLQILNGMPEEIDPDELMYHIFVIQKLQAAEKSAEEGNLVSHAEMIRRSDAWRSSAAGPACSDSTDG